MFGLKNGLSRIVFDEVHLSSGTQGAHHRFLVSRLRQLKYDYGQKNTPRIIGVSATIAEPVQHLQKIWGGPLSNIKHVAGRNTKEGTPVSIMHHVMYKPRNGTPVVGALVDLSSSILHQRRAKGIPRPTGQGSSRNCKKPLVLPTAIKLWVTGIPLCSITRQHPTKIKFTGSMMIQQLPFGNRMPTGTIGRSKITQEERRSVLPVRREPMRRIISNLGNQILSDCGPKPLMQATNRVGICQILLTPTIRSAVLILALILNMESVGGLHQKKTPSGPVQAMTPDMPMLMSYELSDSLPSPRKQKPQTMRMNKREKVERIRSSMSGQSGALILGTVKLNRMKINRSSMISYWLHQPWKSVLTWTMCLKC